MAKDYAAITSVEQLARLADKLLDEDKWVGFDTETGYYGKDAKKRSVDHYHPDQFIVGFSLTNSTEWARYVPLRHDNGGNIDDPEGAWEAVRELLTKAKITAHNAKFEMAGVDKAAGIKLASEGELCDTMLLMYVNAIYSHPNYRSVLGLKDLVEIIFGHKMLHIQELWENGIAKNKESSLRFNTLDVTPKVTAYACEDALWVLPLRDNLIGRVMDERAFMYKLEHAILPIVYEMEKYGVAIDWDGITDAHAKGSTFVPNIENYVKEELGKLAERDLSDLNFNSPPQMKKLLFHDIGLSTTRLTTKGADESIEMEDWQRMSTDAKALTALADEHPAIAKLLKFREVKNLNTRCKKWITEYNLAEDKRVHANYKQAAAEGDESTAPGSGRFSAADPAIQQLPKKWQWALVDWDIDKPENKDAFKTFMGEHTNGQEFWSGNFRNFIIATPGHYLLTFDYSQVELRILAGASQEPALLEAFNTGKDVHTLTAAQMLAKRPEDIDPELERPLGKTFNFALMYGMGVKSLAEQLGISVQRASTLYRQYFSVFSRVSSWFDRTRSVGMERGYAETIFGRKIPVWELRSPKKGIVAKGTRVLINGPIQGSAADYMKIAMVNCHRALVKRGWWMNGCTIIMNQHDALTFEVSNDIDPNELRELLQKCVVLDNVSVLKGYPPIQADWELGQRWGSSSKFDASDVAVFDGEHWVIAKPKQPESIVITVKEAISQEAFKDFIALAKATPGESKATFDCQQGVIDLPFLVHPGDLEIKLSKVLKGAIIT